MYIKDLFSSRSSYDSVQKSPGRGKMHAIISGFHH